MKKLILSVFCFCTFVSALFSLSIDDASIGVNEKFSYLRSLSPDKAIKALTDSDFLKTIIIERIEEFDVVRAGVAFKKGAQAKFFLVSGDEKKPLSNLELIVQYPSLVKIEKDVETSNGIVKTTSYETKNLTTTIKTDSQGIAKFALSSFEYPVLSEVRFFLPIFAGAENEISAYFSELPEDLLENLSVGFACKVGGKKRNSLRLAIDIVDFNDSEAQYGRNMVGTALLGEFMRRGYLWPGNYESGALRKYGVDIENALINARRDFAGNTNDFIFGQSKITRLEKIDGKWHCTCSAHIKIWNMKTDTLAKEIFCEASVVVANNDSSYATSQARDKLGKEVLADIIEFGYEFQ